MDAEGEKQVNDGQLELFEKHSGKIDALIEEIRTDRKQARAAASAKPEPKPEPERVYTAAELQRFVDDGKLTQAEAVEYLATVKSQQAVSESEKRQKEARERERAEGAASALIGQYRAALPELADQSSDTFKRVAKAFQRLRAAGAPDNAATELAAVQIVCGEEPEQAGGRSTPRETTAERQRSVEASGTGGGRKAAERKPAEGSGGLPGWLEPKRSEFYQNAISRGIYKGPKDPVLVKELEILKSKQDAKKGRAA